MGVIGSEVTRLLHTCFSSATPARPKPSSKICLVTVSHSKSAKSSWAASSGESLGAA